FNEWLFCCYRKGFRRCVQAAKRQAVWLSLNCINGKYLWACPHPQPLKRSTKLLQLLDKTVFKTIIYQNL
ncbi:hypothetical protein, partial [Ruminococcus sp.]|uniref:hypothetical protein n=1 Tax=Ruminococcus sp. TaxID=41978 RepID=UPI003AF4E3B7